MERLPELLTEIRHPRREPVPAPMGEVAASAIPSRLTGLLDQALFDSVIARELARLATNSEVDPFFDELVELLGQVVTYRWLAVTATLGNITVSCAHVHPSDRARALTKVTEALGVVEEDGLVLCDTRAQHEASSPPSHKDLERSIWTLDVGSSSSASLAVCVDRCTSSSADRLVFEVVPRELAAALRALLLSLHAQQLARTDALTTLWNRRHGLEYLEQAFAAFKRYGHVLSVVMVDIDHFKRINDTYGRQCGDQALQHVANVLRNTCRKADAVARWGGEEFLLILPSTGSAGARVAAERLRMRLNAQPIRFDSGRECVITVSAGVAQCDDAGYDAALNRADKALYLAKSRGRNRVELG